jgi:putative transposase
MADYAADGDRAYLERSLGAHAAYTLHYHLVWSVHARWPLLTGEVASALCRDLLATGEDAGIAILALHVEPEHVHPLFSLTPAQTVTEAVKRLKGASTRRLRQAFPFLSESQHDSLWNTGYFVRSLGDVNVAQARANLDRQRERHGAENVFTE